MKLGMYCIADKATSFIFPFPAYSDQAAIRNFAVEVNNNPVAKNNPSDFDLYCCGQFDTETGLVEAYSPNKHVRSGMSVVKKEDITNG